MPIKAFLRGDSIDLSILAELHPEPGDPAVRADGSGYYLTSPTLPDSLVKDAGEMLTRASALLRTINGAPRVLSNSYRPVELNGTFRDSTDRQHAVVVADTAHIRAHVFAAGVVISADGQAVQAPTPPAPKYIQLATQHPDVADALAILGRQEPLDWFDLYKLYEIVRDNVDPSPPGQSRKGRPEEADRRWLRHQARSPRIHRQRKPPACQRGRGTARTRARFRANQHHALRGRNPVHPGSGLALALLVQLTS
jgi:hypothetical protein